MGDALSGRTAIVTGSSSGIGRAIVRRFAAEGAAVVTNSRSAERATAAAEEIREEGGEAVGVEADVTDPDEVDGLVETAVETYGGIDVMVNNAADTVIEPAESLPPEDWRRVLEVNLTGTFFGCQAAARRMIERGDGGCILNLSSIMGEQGLAGRAPYCATKGGVNNLTRTLAVEWAEHGILVNALAPGYIRTEMTDRTMAGAGFTEADVRNRTPLDRWGTGEEMAACAVFLASGDHYVTGEVLHADGGWLAHGWGSRGE